METWRHFLIVGLAATALAGNAMATNGTELLYVANSQGDDLTIVRLPDHQPLGSVKVGAHPHGLAASRDGRWLYVSVESSKDVLVLDTASNQIVWRVPVSDCPNQIALSGDGHHLFVPIRLADYVEVIDTQQRRSIGRIKVGRSPHNTLTSADGRHIYATSMDDHRVTIIDAASLAVLDTIPCDGIVRPIVVTRDETRMYAALSDLHGFVVADIPNRKVVQRVLLPPVPEGMEPLVPHTPTHGLGLTPDDRLLVVTSVVGNYVGLFAVPGNRLLGTVATGKAPNWVAFRHDGQVCYVSNAGSDDVSVVDFAACKEVARIPVGTMPKRLVTIVVPERRSSAPPNKRSYSTRFQLDEDPISEGGKWINGEKDGIDWYNVITKNGIAYGAVTQGDYTDPTALLTGTWGKNQKVKARVFSRNQTEKYYQEVEIRLRSRIAPHLCTGYEVFWRCLKTPNAYAEIVRWNGKIRDWTSLKKLTGAQYGVKDGDLVEASIVGNVIKGFVNCVEVISVTDDTFSEGSPGIGFNYGVGETNGDFGFTSYEVESYDD
jgi:YVTN family beta-propeller protein